MKTENRELRVEGIKKVYNGRTIISDISLNIKSSEVVGLLGPNGSGKTTLFYIIVGIVAPDKGSIYVDNVNVVDYPMYKRSLIGFGYLPQDFSVFKDLTVKENILAVAQLYYKNKKQALQQTEKLLEDFSITHICNSKGRALSGGERRRVEMARALAADPSFIFLDEPFAGVDPVATQEIIDLIHNLKKLNIGVLITDHNAKETLGVVDRAYILHNTKIISSGSPDTVMKNEQAKKVYFGDSLN